MSQVLFAAQPLFIVYLHYPTFLFCSILFFHSSAFTHEEAKESVRLAIDEARRLNHQYIGTEHILLGLLRQADSLATLALKEQHLDLEKVRTMTIQVLSQSSK